MRTRERALLLARQGVAEPFRQTRALRTREFSTWLRARGLSYSPDELGRLAAHGVLIPVALYVKDALRSRRYPPAASTLNGRLYGDIGRPVQQENLRRKVPRLRQELDGMLWHPFQLWNVERIDRILSAPRISPSTSLMPATEYARFVARILKVRPASEVVASFVNSDEQQEFDVVLSIAMAVEPLVPEETRGLVTFRFSSGTSGWDQYTAWVGDFDHERLMETTGASVELLRSWHHRLATSAVLRDPIASWRVLMRYAPRSERLTFRREALLAEDLYYVAEVIRRYLEVYHGLDGLPEEDNITYGAQVPPLKEQLYGKRTTQDGDRSVFRNVVRQFGLDPQPRFRWLVEGPSERGFIQRWSDLSHVDLKQRGIELIPLHGVGEVDGERVRTILQLSRNEEVFATATIDADQNAERARKLRTLAGADLLSAGWVLFDPDFEGANFTVGQIARAATSLAQRSPETPNVTITETELHSALAGGSSYWPAVYRLARGELAYLSKGEEWGECLADALWADGGAEQPIVVAFRAALRADTSNYRFTLIRSMIGPDGSIITRPGTSSP